MTMPRLASALLSLTLLLASTVGVAVHQHTTAIERRGFDCAVDHRDEPASRPHGAGVELRGGGPHHRHQCLGCHLSGHRFLVASCHDSEADLGDGDRDRLLPATPPPAAWTWTGATPRGPPRA